MVLAIVFDPVANQGRHDFASGCWFERGYAHMNPQPGLFVCGPLAGVQQDLRLKYQVQHLRLDDERVK